jgi:5-deoxy-D-glucuronate isomerase
MVGETFNRPGGWTSYPSHKHDEVNPPHELPYEEIYFYLFKPQAGFAIQRVYDAPEHEEAMDVTMFLRDGDTGLIPPGYQMYYLWAMCGEVGHRTYGQTTVDPDLRWLLPDAIERRTPMGRIGKMEDLTGPAIFLASRESDFMCGQALVIDGGWLAYGFLQM